MESKNIYQELWLLDLKHNGCTVSSRDKEGNWILPKADIKLDEQHEASKKAHDMAPNPLFAEVNEAKLALPTYQAFIKLLNNYVVNVRETEDHIGDNEVEDEEREAFLDLVMETSVIKRTLQYVQKELKINISACDFRAHLTRLWFKIYTNYFNRTPVPFASGFEHVFVGEGKQKGKGIGGYHSWIKYYLDEKNQRVNFRGFNYDGNLGKRSKAGYYNPYVATISMDWKPVDIFGNQNGTLSKDLGGFFVGPSPEFQLAMPTLAYFEAISGKFSNTNRSTEKRVALQNALFNLVLYRSTTEDQKEGDKIRSFFPKFIRPVKDIPGEGVISCHPDDWNEGDVAITKALINPEGSDLGREWVEIENRSEAIIDLKGWTIGDKLKRRQIILGKIEPNKQRRIMVTRDEKDSAQLGNKGGKITLFDEKDKIVAVVNYGRVSDGEVLYFKSCDEK